LHGVPVDLPDQSSCDSVAGLQPVPAEMVAQVAAGGADPV